MRLLYREQVPPRSECRVKFNRFCSALMEPEPGLDEAAALLRASMLHGRWRVIGERRWGRGSYRNTMLGSEMVEWVMAAKLSPPISRAQAAGAWQALLEAGFIHHVRHEEREFLDKALLYRWSVDSGSGGWGSWGWSEPTAAEAAEGLDAALAAVLARGPEAQLRAILGKPPWKRSPEEAERVWEELNETKALSHLSTMLKRQLGGVVGLETFPHAGSVLFRQGDEGKSWYIIFRGSVHVIIAGKGIVCSLHEGDDFGKLALVNDAPRAATIVTRDDNAQFLRIDKEHFDRILRDVEANTVRLKEYGEDVLVLEKIPVRTQPSVPPQQPSQPPPRSHRYSVMAGRPTKVLEYVLETRLEPSVLNSRGSDTLVEDFILTHPLFITSAQLADALTTYYQDGGKHSNGSRHFGLLYKRRVVEFVKAWVRIVGKAFFQDSIANAYLEELYSALLEEDKRCGSDVASELRDVMTLREAAMAESARTPVIVLDSGHLPPPNHTPHMPPDTIRHFDQYIIRVHILDGSCIPVRVAVEKSVGEILEIVCRQMSLDVPVDEMRLVEVKSSGEKVVWGRSTVSVGSKASLNGRLWAVSEASVGELCVCAEQLGPRVGVHGRTLELLSSSQMAARLAFSHFRLLSAVHEAELLQHVFRVPSWPVPTNLDLLVRAFNSLQFVVPTEILLAPSSQKRLHIIQKFIKIAAYCKFHQDLLGMLGIVLGLSNVAVSRLSSVWSRVPRKVLRRLSVLEETLEPSRNHRSYRGFVAGLEPPLIPFLPLTLKDLTFIHHGNKTSFDRLANFEKMHMIGDVLRHFRFCKSKSFDVTSCDPRSALEAQQLVRNFDVIDNQAQLDELSRQIQPPRAKCHSLPT